MLKIKGWNFNFKSTIKCMILSELEVTKERNISVTKIISKMLPFSLKLWYLMFKREHVEVINYDAKFSFQYISNILRALQYFETF